MMKKMLVVFCVVVVMIIWNTPDWLPQQELAIHDHQNSNASSGFVGGGCSTDKCLLIYSAPWCPTCQRLTPVMIRLTQALRDEGVTVDVIVGHDSEANLMTYAKKFPFPDYVDRDNAFYHSAEIKAVPYYVLTDASGDILNDISGGFRQVQDFKNYFEL